MESFYWKFLRVMGGLLGTRYQESPSLWYQCVAFAKQFALLQYGVKLGSFSWTAMNGWNTGSPFTDKRWKRIVYTKWLVPDAGDIVFFNVTAIDKAGHVAVADGACTAISLSVDEQNALLGNGSGIGGDAITHRTVSYSGGGWRGNCVGWFHFNNV